MSTIWFTADTHFSHGNIIEFCHRPFAGIRLHDQKLIEAWNRHVAPNDTIYHLGDLGFGSPSYLAGIVSQLNGKKHLILGNHDKPNRLKRIVDLFESIEVYKEIKVFDKDIDGHRHIVLFHYPIESWSRKFHGSWHLHGHTHNSESLRVVPGRLNVGVDLHGYKPISFSEARSLINAQFK